MRTITRFACPFGWMALLAVGGMLGVPRTMDLARFQYTEVHMGMQTRIVLYAPDERQARDGAAAAFRRIAELDGIMSDYRKDSELNRVCSDAVNGPVRVSTDLFRVLSHAQMMARESGGAFDVTVGPFVLLWRQARRTGTLPEPAQIDAARAFVGWEKLRLNPSLRQVELAAKGMKLDLGGIAKGYACEEAWRVLRQKGLGRSLVEMGGDIYVGDRPPDENGWLVEIPNAEEPSKRRQTRANVAVSTSGDTEQYVEIGGVRYSHIVDPRTGLGLTHRTSVTIISPRGWLSDALSTAVSVLGENEGRALVRRFARTEAYIRQSP